MSFASYTRNRRSERAIALISAVSLLLSLMVVFAAPALAHHPTMSASAACDEGSPVIQFTSVSWKTDGSPGSGHDDVRVEISVDGGSWTEVASGAYEAPDYRFSGTIDATSYVGSTVQLRSQVVGPWDNGGSPGNGHADATTAAFEITDDCGPDVESVSISLELGCQIGWDNGEFTMYGSVDFEVTPEEGVVSIALTPKAGGDPSIVGATWTDDAVQLHPWAYTWEATMADGYDGDPFSGEILFERDWFEENCSCPTGSIDLTDTGALLASQGGLDSRKGEPASPVDIPAGTYEIHLASFDDHSNQPDQGPDQTIEEWRLTDLIDNTGAFASPATGDLPDGLNFQSYHVTSGGPVAVPEFSSADIWATHVLLGGGNPVNSVYPVCAKLMEATQGVDVGVTPTSCLVNDQGQPVGDIDITIDPDAAATVNVYSDAGMTDLVGTTQTSGSVEGLAPGTYYWEAIAEPGYELNGPAEGSVTIEDCDVTIDVGGLCVLNGDDGSGEISVEISTPGAATVVIRNEANEVVDTLTESGTVTVPEDATYTWEATASAGFSISGDDSGSVDIEECTRSIELEYEAFCELDAPNLAWDVTPLNFDADEVTITWNDIDPGDPLYSSVQPLSGSMLWPGIVIEDGEVVDWPGWVNVDGQWVPGDDGYQDTVPVASITFSVNPSLTVDVDYPPCSEPPSEIIIVKEVIDGSDTEQAFEFDASYDDDGFSLAHGESNESGHLAPGTYSVAEILPDGWSLISAVCDDGSEVDSIELAVGETVTCTFTNLEDEVSPSIVVTVEAACDPDDDTQAIITANIPVADGATIVVRDSNDQVVATFTETGSVVVADNATYTWEATPGDGFEFAPGSESSGTLNVEDCIDELPFTGIDSDVLVALSIVLLASGVLLVTTARTKEN